MKSPLLVRYLVTTGVFLLIDIAWLALIAPKLYKANIGHLMADKPNLPAAGTVLPGGSQGIEKIHD